MDGNGLNKVLVSVMGAILAALAFGAWNSYLTGRDSARDITSLKELKLPELKQDVVLLRRDVDNLVNDVGDVRREQIEQRTLSVQILRELNPQAANRFENEHDD